MDAKDIKIKLNPNWLFGDTTRARTKGHLRMQRITPLQLQQLKACRGIMGGKATNNTIFKNYHDRLVASYGYDPKKFVIAPDGWIVASN